MKYIIPLLLLLPLIVNCQRYSIESEAVCWNTGSVDSNLVRLTQVSFTGATREVGYINSSGLSVTPAGGTILYGQCECCNATTPVTSSQIKEFNASQPTFNPLNPPSTCNSTANAFFESSVDSTHVTFQLNGGSALPFSFFAGEDPKRATASISTSLGSGFNTIKITVTNSSGTESQERTIDCGGS